jgi:peptidyl-prolyl cis-trans isomerase D
MIRFLQTPGPAVKIALGGILLVICGSMVVTLIPGGLGSDMLGTTAPGKGVVAKVDGGDVTADQVRQTARQMLQQQMQQANPQTMAMLLPYFSQRAAEQLITRQALIAEAGHLGLKSSPQEIQEELQHGRYSETFFPGGNFIGETEYEDMLSKANLTPATFEDSVGKDIMLGKLQALISGSATVSESAIRDQFIKQNSKVKFDYAVLKQDDLRKALHPTDVELKSFYDAHKQQYANSNPEKRKIKYAVVDVSRIAGQVQVSHDDLVAYYDQHRDQYRTPEQVKVSHILIKTPLPGPDGKVDEKAVTEAHNRAADLLKQIKGGANFEELAKKYSEDPGSAKEGGSLGFIGHGRTVAEFDKAAFSLPKGQISDLVKSSSGFHIIRVDDKQDAHMKTLDEVKDQIEPILKQQKAQQAAQKQAEGLLSQAKSEGLDAAAGAKSVPVITSDYFGRKDMLPGLGPAAQFMDAVFIAVDKAPPDMAATSQGFVVYQLLAIKPASTPTFEEIRSRVEDEFKTERSSALLGQKTQELSDRAKTEHDLKRAAKELGATVKTSDFVLPDGQVPDLGSMTGPAAAAFAMKPGEISGPINNGGTGAVLSVLENQRPSDADFAAKRDQIRDSLLQSKQQELFELFVSNIREQMEKSGKIKINQEEMKALTHAGAEAGM